MKQLDPITLPMPAIGTQLDSEGGFYGGLIHLGADILAIVWAPKLEGETTSKWLDTSTSVLGATSCFDSMANTLAMAAAGSDLAKKALAANIGGHTDWCIPARDVLEMGYRYLKPGTEENYCSFRDGDNASSIPSGYLYTVDSPAQTTAEAFRAGNPEAFDDVWYVSSTQSSEYDAFGQYFSYGLQGSSAKVYERRSRFVRLIPTTLSSSFTSSLLPPLLVANHGSY